MKVLHYGLGGQEEGRERRKEGERKIRRNKLRERRESCEVLRYRLGGQEEGREGRKEGERKIRIRISEGEKEGTK